MQLQWITPQQIQSKEAFLNIVTAYHVSRTAAASNIGAAFDSKDSTTQHSNATCFLVETPALIDAPLSEVSSAFFDGNKDIALQLFEAVKNNVFALVDGILVDQKAACISRLGDLFTEIEWLLHDKPVRAFPYYKDQIVCTGAVLGSALFYHFLLEQGVDAVFVDIRDCIVTSDDFGKAGVLEPITQARIQQTFIPGRTHVTQAGIGATDQNENVRLIEASNDWLKNALTDL
jgi:aspartate kinase